jgi:hypothetical protein
MDLNDTMHELLDNIVQRIEEEIESTGRDLTFLVFIADTGTGLGDLRSAGDVDALAGHMLRIQKAIFDELDSQGLMVRQVEIKREGGGLTIEKMRKAQERLNEIADEDDLKECVCGHEKKDHFFGDNRDLSTPCSKCDCENFRQEDD